MNDIVFMFNKWQKNKNWNEFQLIQLIKFFYGWIKYLKFNLLSTPKTNQCIDLIINKAIIKIGLF